MRRIALPILAVVMLASMVRVSAYAQPRVQEHPTDCGTEYADWYIPDGATERVFTQAYNLAYNTGRAEWETTGADWIEVCIETDHPDESVWWFFSDGTLEMNYQEEPTEQYQITRIGVNTGEYQHIYLPLISN